MPTVTTNFFLLQENGYKILLQDETQPQITCNPSAVTNDGCNIIVSATTTTTP